MIELVHDDIERAIAVGLVTGITSRQQAEEYLEELALLADTAGASVVHRILQERNDVDPAFFIGKGKVEQIAQLAESDQIALVIFDDDLSPAQLRNLERVIKRKIIDRSGLILDIFANRARTNEARTQVELAQLQYLLPRLTRQWTHLSKQYGGIRTKGPGETQIETDRRMIRKRISVLKEKLDKIGQQRETRRKGRREFVNASLVGYTNAGKSTTLNALASSDVFVENRLFATLDTTVRLVELSQTHRVLVSDTVGFIRKLPHHLVASFKSTLEEVVESDILMHIIDISHPHFEDQMQVVMATLEEIGASNKPMIHVFNKIDLLGDRLMIQDLRKRFSPAVFISAERGINISGLKELLQISVQRSSIEIAFSLRQDQQRLLSLLYEIAEIKERHYDDGCIHIKAIVGQRNLDQVKKLLAGIEIKMLDAQKPMS